MTRSRAEGTRGGEPRLGRAVGRRDERASPIASGSRGGPRQGAVWRLRVTRAGLLGAEVLGCCALGVSQLEGAGRAPEAGRGGACALPRAGLWRGRAPAPPSPAPRAPRAGAEGVGAPLGAAPASPLRAPGPALPGCAGIGDLSPTVPPSALSKPGQVELRAVGERESLCWELAQGGGRLPEDSLDSSPRRARYCTAACWLHGAAAGGWASSARRCLGRLGKRVRRVHTLPAWGKGGGHPRANPGALSSLICSIRG